MLTRDQLIANINAMEDQGARPDEVQAYLDTFKGQQPPAPQPPPAPGALVTNKGPLGNFIANVTGAGKTVASFLTGSERAAGADIAAALPGNNSILGTGVDQLNKSNQANAQSDIAFVQAMHARQKAGQPLTPAQQQIYDGILNNHAQPTTAADLTPALNKSNLQVVGDIGGVAADALTAGTYSKAALAAPSFTRFTAPVAKQAAKLTAGQIGKQTLVRSGIGAGVGYGYDVTNNLQQGKTGLEAITPGAATITGAAIPALIGGVRMGVTLAKGQGPRFIDSLIKPKQADFSYGKDPGRTVSELGITGNDLKDFERNITTAKQDVGQQLGSIYSNPANAGVRINADADVERIDAAIKDAAKGGKNNQAVVTQLQNIKDGLLYEHGIDGNGNIVRVGKMVRDVSQLNPQEAQDFIQHVADQTQFTGRPSDDKTVNSVLKQIYGGIREKINTGVGANNPEIEKLNQQYADLTSAEIATRNRDKIVQRSNLVSLPAGGAAAAGAIVTAIATGGAAVPAILGGAGALAVEKSLASTAVKTRVAAWLSKESPSVIRKFFVDNPQLAPVFTRAFPALLGKLRNNPPENPANQ